MPGVVVYLTFTLMYGGIITHSFITCKLHLKQSGKSPNQCCKLSLKSPKGNGYDIYIYSYSSAHGIECHTESKEHSKKSLHGFECLWIELSDLLPCCQSGVMCLLRQVV